ncbi:hypothetical protein Rumeso_03013 [Rubellimicrobium mesophilum DSM 19309]|uniref:Dynamin N-terminal domain-containing protein n=1 Tax=Rubellimicrobium mesophilum DSM 19309 TaxID=442562 RepID=A0A017HMP4_9RHOB|nr:dynamin family protein [Rubellimicrobium mesophilum]EYD75443.1 hypothetical protein Rumeso_03013 [Rubellimicrobium mesophilum DSM 19309]
MPRTDQPRLVTDEQLDRLSTSARARPRIALMGEFSSGKSTLLNLLIGEALLPTKVTATELPPVWFSHGEPRAWWVGKDGGEHPLDFGSFQSVPMSARYVRVTTPSPMLERCDIVDTPGISDPNLEEDSWRFAVGHANFVLWCTSATQAWRETERSTWTSLPERLRANSVMVVTRSDKLGPGDREKVKRRLSRESFGLFGGLVFLSTPDAVRGLAALTESNDPNLWHESGGADLEERIASGLDAVRAARLDLLDRYQSTGPAAPRVVTLPTPPLPTPPLAEPAPVVVLPTPAPAPSADAFDFIRPRRVEVPEVRRSDRPLSEEPADPLAAMRAGWMNLRDEAPAEPAPVLRLPDPVRPPAQPAWTEPWSDEDDTPLVLDRAWAAPAPAEESPAPEPASPSEEAASIDAVLAAVAVPAPEPEAPAEILPRAVRIWRDIVARNSEIPSNSPILAMIDQLLCELSREDGLSDGIGPEAATIIGQTRAA